MLFMLMNNVLINIQKIWFNLSFSLKFTQITLTFHLFHYIHFATISCIMFD